jgi:FkbM family methyltransferase
MLSTRTKVRIARAAFFAIGCARRLAGLDDTVEVLRDGLHWRLDLRQGIDLAIYLGVFERSTAKALRRLIRPGQVVLDVGANVGAHTLPLARLVGDVGRVVAFEPTAFARRKLIANLALNPELVRRVTVEPTMLIGESSAKLPPAIYSSWPLVGRSQLHTKHRGELKSTEGARARRLDDWLAEVGIEHVDLIKVDVDGYECEVLSGATALLRRVKPILVMELAPYIVDERHTLDELLDILRRREYRLESEHGGKQLPTNPKELRSLISEGASMNIIAR